MLEKIVAKNNGYGFVGEASFLDVGVLAAYRLAQQILSETRCRLVP